MQATLHIKSTRMRAAILAALVGLILAAGIVRIMTYERYLPYIDNFDEPNMYLLGRDQLGREHDPVVTVWLAGYPPLYPWINAGVQRSLELLTHRPWYLPVDYFYALRFTAAISGIVTTLLLISIGWQLGGAVGGAIAGLIWGLSPTIVINNNLAIPDPFVFLFTAATLTTAIRAYKKNSFAWATVSLIAGLLGTYAKYPAVFMLIPWGLVMLALLRKRLAWRWIVVQGGLIALAVGYLVLGVRALGLSNREADTVRGSALDNILTWSREWNNLSRAVEPIGAAVLIILVVASVPAYLYARRKKWPTIDLFWVGVLAISAAVGIMITVTFTNVGDILKMRHTIPITLMFIALVAMALAQIYWTLSYWAQEKRSRVLRYVPAMVVALAICAVGIPLLPTDMQTIAAFSRVDTRVLLWQWADASIPMDGLILTHPEGDLHSAWNRNWSGYNGVKSFQWWFDTNPAASSPQAFQDRQISYFVMSDGDKSRYKPEEIDPFVKQLTLIKTIPASTHGAGPTIYFYRMMPPKTLTNVIFGDQITLAGYDLSATTLKPGETLHFRPYWRAPSPPTNNYSMFIHLSPADHMDQNIAQYDGAPTTPDRLTLTWIDPAELLIGSDDTLTIPSDAKPGTYTLQLGLYNFTTGQRLSTADGKDSFELKIVVDNGIF